MLNPLNTSKLPANVSDAAIAAHKTLQATLIDYEFKYAYELSVVARKEAATYFLLHYSGAFLSRRTTDYGKVIIKDGTPFIVMWPSPSYQAEAYSSARVAISFRRKHGEHVGYAIPKILYGAAPLDGDAQA